MEKVIAVVVTYNRNELLYDCITALRKQTRQVDAILVVNNGSTDSTLQWLQNQSDLLFVTQENVGSGGGFNTGIKWAVTHNYSWIWCMDDDGYPKEDALEKLLDADDGSLKLMNCAVIDKNDKHSFVWKTHKYNNLDQVSNKIINGVGHPFNGTLIHRKIVERVGVPQSNFFLWGDETEYYYRIIRKNKIPVCTIADSIHYHPASAFSIKKDWDYMNGWKMYFYIRNRFHVHKAKFNNKTQAFLNYACFLLAFAGITILYQKTDKLKKLKFIFWPATDAFMNNFNASPSLILSKLSTGKMYSTNKSLSTFVKNIKMGVLTNFTFSRIRRPANA